MSPWMGCSCLNRGSSPASVVASQYQPNTSSSSWGSW